MLTPEKRIEKKIATADAHVQRLRDRLAEYQSSENASPIIIAKMERTIAHHASYSHSLKSVSGVSMDQELIQKASPLPVLPKQEDCNELPDTVIPEPEIAIAVEEPQIAAPDVFNRAMEAVHGEFFIPEPTATYVPDKPAGIILRTLRWIKKNLF